MGAPVNLAFVAALAARNRARVVHLDGHKGTAMLRLDPPPGGHPTWPANVVALRAVPYADACRMPGLVKHG